LWFLSLLENWLFLTEFSDGLSFVWNHLYVSDRFGTVQKHKYFRPTFVPKLSKNFRYRSNMPVSHRFRMELVKKLDLTEICLKHLDGFGTKHWNLFMWLYKTRLFLFTFPLSLRAHYFHYPIPSFIFIFFLSHIQNLRRAFFRHRPSVGIPSEIMVPS
jgi:hypothetical protein